MPPRPSLSISTLISSTSYPPVPDIEKLESLKNELITRRHSCYERIVYLDPSAEERLKKERKEIKKREKLREARENEEDKQRAEGGGGGGFESKGEKGKLDIVERTKASGVVGSPKGNVRVKRERTSVSPAPSITSMTSARPNASLPITYAGHNKKKQKRVVESDEESRASPPAHSHAHTSSLKVKLPQNKGRPSLPSATSDLTPIATPLNGPGSHIDFSIPAISSKPLIPPRPGVQKPLQAGPKKQSEVNEDYSNVKAPNQVAFPTFWSGVEPYLREIREDDLAMLGFKADAPELFDIPPRGRHYTEQWDEEDPSTSSQNIRIAVPNLRQLNGTYPAKLPTGHFIPTHDLKDETLVEELRGLGSVTERILAAVLGRRKSHDNLNGSVNGNASEKDSKSEKGEKVNGINGVEGKLAEDYEPTGPVRVESREMEDRVKKELRGVMLLGEHEDYDATNRDDDEITSSLRQCQRQLLNQIQINDSRKLRLAEISKHRLAYAEYQNSLEGIEKSIETLWSKRVKKYGSKKNQPRPPVAENLKRLVEVRKRWLEIGERLRDRPKGEVKGLPNSTIYTGIEDQRGEREDEEVVDGELDAMEVDIE